MIGHDLSEFVRFQTALDGHGVGDAAIEQIFRRVLIIYGDLSGNILAGDVGHIQAAVQRLDLQLILLQA